MLEILFFIRFFLLFRFKLDHFIMYVKNFPKFWYSHFSKIKIEAEVPAAAKLWTKPNLISDLICLS